MDIQISKPKFTVPGQAATESVEPTVATQNKAATPPVAGAVQLSAMQMNMLHFGSERKSPFEGADVVKR